MKTKTSENITAFVDNELKNNKQEKELSDKIETDAELKFEYQIQNSMKNLLQKRFAEQKAPEHLRSKVLYSIRTEVPASRSNQSIGIFEQLKQLLNPGKIQFAFGMAIILAALLFLFQPFSTQEQTSNTSIKQARIGGIFFEANNNFDKIREGKLKCQITSSNPEEVASFFKKAGVSYEVSIPKFKNWDLAGGVVSEANGKKLAHQVYSGPNNEILYLYQVSDNYCKKSIVQISDEMLSYIENNPYYKVEEQNQATYLWKSGSNIYTLVTNEKCDKVEKHFLSSFISF